MCTTQLHSFSSAAAEAGFPLWPSLSPCNACTISSPFIYHFLLSLAYCLLPLAYQSVSPAFHQFFFQAVWPSFPSFHPLFSPLSFSPAFLSFSLSLSSFTLWVSLPPPLPLPPPHTHTRTHTLAHSYSTCVSLLGVVWGNQILLQIHLFILLIPAPTQGPSLLVFSLWCLCLTVWV